MAKKGSLSLIYVIGMALVVIGFICPVFGSGRFATNGFNYIDFSNMNWATWGALLVLVGAVAGLILAFVGNNDLYKLIALIVTILGGIILFANFNKNGLTQFVGKQFLKHAAVGFYLIIAGWVVALIGYFTKR